MCGDNPRFGLFSSRLEQEMKQQLCIMIYPKGNRYHEGDPIKLIPENRSLHVRVMVHIYWYLPRNSYIYHIPIYLMYNLEENRQKLSTVSLLHLININNIKK